MNSLILIAVALPFLGTVVGAAGVLFFQSTIGNLEHRFLLGFSAGIMTAASVWSLLIPALEYPTYGIISAEISVLLGIWAGFLILLLLDRLIDKSRQTCNKKTGNNRFSVLMTAVTLHNLPEGMAVGVAVAGYLENQNHISAATVFVLAAGVALQNIPEGAIISMPMYADGATRKRSFMFGALSGAAEPIGAVVTILLSDLLASSLPWLLSFSAGAMLYVVVKELIPEAAGNKNSVSGVLSFAAGFSIMMLLDVLMG